MNNNTSFASRRFGIRQLTTGGILAAISIVLGLSGYGIFQVPFLPLAKVTIMHIPVIIGAIIEGPAVGAVIGLIFGLSSLIQNIVAPTSALSFAFINPLVSVLPRVLIAVTSYYSYKLLANAGHRRQSPGKLSRNDALGAGVGAALGSLTNTFGVLTMIYILYAVRFAEVMNKPVDTIAAVIYGIALTNGVPEAVAAIIITVPVVFAVRNLRRRP